MVGGDRFDKINFQVTTRDDIDVAIGRENVL